MHSPSIARRGTRNQNQNVEAGTRRLERSSRPLLKWAGGKRQLLPVIRQLYPSDFSTYVEPFLGSGAVFFDLAARGLLTGKMVQLADANPDLVGCYTVLRDQTEAVIRALDDLAAAHRTGGDAFFYEVRDGRFNPARAADQGAYTPELAAMFIYLNRTGFNGLFRLNRRGEFNVPAGRYVNPRICDPAHLWDVAAALGAPGVTIEVKPFETVLAAAGERAFVYCDPPYAPLSTTACFSGYTADGFGPSDHERLRDAVVAAALRGASVVVSNSSAPLIERLYTSAEARRTGLSVRRVPARRAINSRATRRGPVDELIITNIERPSTAMNIKPRMARARLRAKRRFA